MSVLDKIAAFLDRREVRALRDQVQEQQRQIGELTRESAQQVKQIGEANSRTSRTTNRNLEALARLREHGISTDGLTA
jgi:hypothetical protein